MNINENVPGGPTYLTSAHEQPHPQSSFCGEPSKSGSRQSLLDIVGSRLGVTGGISLGVSLI